MASQIFIKTRAYYLLTKPGIILGNAITTVGGFALASKGHFDFLLFLASLAGLFCVIAAACVFNNYIDRESDKKMARTKNRALVKGEISGRNALIFAALLTLLGFLMFSFYTNLLTVCVALIGFLVYVILYSNLKHRTTYATLIGSIAGAVPPVIGYTAVSDCFDIGAFILFMTIVLWQMPHFFAIAIYQFNDYLAASIPVLPVKKGMQETKVQMLLYVIAFGMTASMLTVFGYTGYLYLAATVLLALAWLWLSIQGFKAANDKVWARKMFLFSLVIVPILSLLMSLDGSSQSF